MTTDPLPPHRLLAGAAAALTLWFTGVALATALFQPTAQVMVFAPRATALRAAAATGAALIDLRPGVTRMRASGADAVLRLYTNGAWLVWPAMDGGCLATHLHRVLEPLRMRSAKLPQRPHQAHDLG